MLLNTRLLERECAVMMIREVFIKIRTYIIVLAVVGAAGQQGVHAAQSGPTPGAGRRTVTAQILTAVPA